MKRLTRYRCPDCGGHDIGFTGSLSWDAETQQYHVEDVYGDNDIWCRDCIAPDDDDDDDLSITECTPIEEVSDDGGETWGDL